MAQGTRKTKAGQTSAARAAGPTTPPTLQDETRMAIRRMAEESGKKSVEAARKRIEREMRAALRASAASG